MLIGGYPGRHGARTVTAISAIAFLFHDRFDEIVGH